MSRDDENDNCKQISVGKKNNSNPFHTIVVTSPDAQSAKAALKGPLSPSSLPPSFTDDGDTGSTPSPRIYSTSDPFDTRMGSGGGTLAALDLADNNNSNNNNNSTNVAKEQKGSVLIIHAGGQSSRCPTQMTLGKAWTSLPTSSTASSSSTNDNHDYNDNAGITNPTYILIESLSNVLSNLPQGSVVVAASDVLLSLPMQSPIDFDKYENDIDNHNHGHGKVLGLAVPAPLETAKNHGVFVVGDDDDNDDDSNDISNGNYCKMQV